MSDSKSYRVLNEELEEVIQKLQSEGLDIDDVILEYQRDKFSRDNGKVLKVSQE